jgi:outer membrane biosynthesis protein TonB
VERARNRDDRVRERAYLLWERSDRRHGEAHYWHQAEREIDAEIAGEHISMTSPAAVPSAPARKRGTAGAAKNGAAPKPAASKSSTRKSAAAKAPKEGKATKKAAKPKDADAKPKPKTKSKPKTKPKPKESSSKEQ